MVDVYIGNTNAGYGASGPDLTIYSLVNELITAPGGYTVHLLGHANVILSVAGAIESTYWGVTGTGPNQVVSLLGTGTITSDAIGILLSGTGATVTNEGVVQGDNTGIHLTSTDAMIENAGTIDGGAFGIVTGVGSGTISNTGSIEATLYAVYIDGDYDIINDGDIVSSSVGVLLSGTTTRQKLVNTGLIDATSGVAAGDGIQKVLNSGSITGIVQLGGGHDTYRAIGDGQAGAVYGGAGHDLLIGRDANDAIVGDAGNDKIRGHMGNDTLFGRDDQDWIDGGRGNDYIWGEVGDDTLRGGADNDTLSGGTGYDQLHGGSGEDTFQYAVSGGRDLVMDFRDDFDILDLSWLGLSLDEIEAAATQPSRDVVFDFGAGDVLRVKNITVAALLDDIVI